MRGRFVTPQQTDVPRAVKRSRSSSHGPLTASFSRFPPQQPHLRSHSGGQQSSSADTLLTDRHRDGQTDTSVNLHHGGEPGKVTSSSPHHPLPGCQRGEPLHNDPLNSCRRCFLWRVD
ncbi:hypothetical protein KUCAC02_015703 [Chaenocephalus aceratus]|uniref:Uncharacterized protein n=1 Tax=Chaenocephalus aceratus TaxID=36190 RepID=A0ACB9Y0B0_CHAAC|nr:hypothetical protein KUCAC02_015703 [Chaenocephalus aceratus]